MNDEQRIRKLIEEWMSATIAGDLNKIESLVTDDVVFLSPGNPPMRGRDKFLAVQREVFSHVRIEPEADIQEIKVSGEMAYCWNHLTVNILPISGGAAMRRKGYTLTVLRKNDSGQWQVSRDANLLGEAE